MKIIKGNVKEEFSRDLYWVRIVFLSDDEEEKAEVLAAASLEYLEDSLGLSGQDEITQEHLDGWKEEVVDKWSAVGDELFEKDVHFDPSYAGTKEGQANGLEFLRSVVEGS